MVFESLSRFLEFVALTQLKLTFVLPPYGEISVNYVITRRQCMLMSSSEGEIQIKTCQQINVKERKIKSKEEAEKCLW